MSKNELRFPKLMATKDQLTAAAGLISIPAKLVHHARQVFLKMMDINLQELLFLRETLGLKSEKIPLQFSTA